MSAVIWSLDALLAGSLIVVGWQALASTAAFRAIALFVAFGLLMTLAWVRLDAVDVAIAEAGIGTGFSGALFLAGLARLQRLEAEQRRARPGER